MQLSEIKGIGPVRAKNLSAVGITSLRDLLYTFPVRYEDHETVFPCSTRQEGLIQIRGKVVKPPVLQRFKGLTKVSCQIQDESGIMPAQWFNSPWIVRALHCGETVRLYGRLIMKDGRRYLQNPKILTDTGWIPVYKKIQGFPQKSYRRLAAFAAERASELHPENLPDAYREKHRLCRSDFAFREIHFPTSTENLNDARRRISFEQILIYLVYISKAAGESKKSFPIITEDRATEKYWHSFRFEPTQAQKRVLEEIACDLKKDQAMKRLVQGDVGCGKTAIAFGAIVLAKSGGFQSAMMAPTEILAAQHYKEAVKSLSFFGVRCRLLTGSTKMKERKEILSELSEGRCDAVFGTQALISENVEYGRLGLVITDEQHRFGVNQRTSLQKKGTDAEARFPHVLVMSATPIPRSLALILYGDLDLSLVDEMPKGRIPVNTRIVKESRRQDLYQYLYQEIQAGKQAYIVCPMVEDNPNPDDESGDEEDDDTGQLSARTAKGVYQELAEGKFADIPIGLTWGAQKSEEKNQTLQDFNEGKTQILVATTVVEVGVNNPNATIMIIENAERFGLSQLHQLRGRVGRGTMESWCFLVSDKEEKLKILRETNDGFLVSQKDLEIRGPGEIIGTRQSGHLDESPAAGGDIRLLDEVSRSVQELRRSEEAADRDLLQRLEQQAEGLYRHLEIGIN